MNYTLKMHAFYTLHAGHMQQSVPQNVLIYLRKLVVQASYVQHIISNQTGAKYILTFGQAELI